MEEVCDPTDPLSVAAQVIQRNRSMLLITTPHMYMSRFGVRRKVGHVFVQILMIVYTAQRVFQDTS